jgi:XTP/dITP diphosphohydrolase
LIVQTVVLASNNAGKLKELNKLLAPLNIDVIAQAELGITDAEETGLTFVENAILKARWAAEHSGLPAIADDSGLSVDALDGAPGIYSARYSGQGDAANNTKLLAALEGEQNRRAHYMCALAFMRFATDPSPLLAEGRWHGSIRLEPVGTGGFGYDPIFQAPETNTSAAQLSIEQKQGLSHRSKAVASLLPQIAVHLSGGS